MISFAHLPHFNPNKMKALRRVLELTHFFNRLIEEKCRERKMSPRLISYAKISEVAM